MALAAQATALPAADVGAARDRATPIAAQVVAKARILRPVRIRFGQGEIAHSEDVPSPSQRSDAEGRLWVEFN